MSARIQVILNAEDAEDAEKRREARTGQRLAYKFVFVISTK
jgi:hypothetical protein